MWKTLVCLCALLALKLLADAECVADMINMITLPFIPKTACWVHGRSEPEILLAM